MILTDSIIYFFKKRYYNITKNTTTVIFATISLQAGQNCCERAHLYKTLLFRMSSWRCIIRYFYGILFVGRQIFRELFIVIGDR